MRLGQQKNCYLSRPRLLVHSLKLRSDYQELVRQLGIVEKEGILRCTGRMGNADLQQEATEPIVLTKDHWLTERIIMSCHQRVHHCGQ